MARTPRRSVEDDDDSLAPRRPSERAQLRAALALEEAGELQEAARLFEYVGEHAQAASLRLEHAETLRDEQQRLAVLREGCARNPANSDQGQALHRALGEALLRVAEGLEPGARKRALVLEAAQALEVGQRGGEAGRLYEKLGLLARAARAYTEAGDIDRLEAVHAALDERDQTERELRTLEREVEAAIAMGRRSLALATLQDHLRESGRANRQPRPALASALAELERRTLREGKLGVIVYGPSVEVVRVIGRERLRIGRAPHCEITIDGAALSREHSELALADGGLIVRDLGSRAGTFVDGQALELGEDWPIQAGESIELALGIAASFALHRPSALDRTSALRHPIALLRSRSIDAPPDRLVHAWTLFAPQGGSLWTSPTRRWPFELEFVGGQVVLTARADTWVSLRGEPIGPGASIELLVHDRVRFEPAGAAAFEIEIVEL
ncbi:FHA domain-containing protein [Nannocystaceae bacterium ST9]